MTGENQEIILGVGGGIAAYKSCDLLRRLRDLGYAVTVVPTPSSLNFVGQATWEALSGRAVTTQVFEKVEEVRHISLAKSAKFMIIAPATADLIARMAQGRADDLLTNLVLAVEIPILVVPAMHPAMWSNSATKTNVATLRSRGVTVMEPDVGALTSGDFGAGRFPTTTAITDEFQKLLGVTKDLAGFRILITAGGTREAIDPVRYIGNRSSGIQGFAFAEAALLRGASVKVIAANCEIAASRGIEVIRVESASEMLQALQSSFDSCDLLIMSAAVADAKPTSVSSSKISKANFESIALVENPDLLATVSARKVQQRIIAFAAQTNDDIDQARIKLANKGADLLYLNNVTGGAIFGSEFTQGYIISSAGDVTQVAETTKDTLAHKMLTQALLS